MLEQIAVIGKLKDSTIVKFSTKGLPSGITEITLFDNRLRPIAERLVFIHPDEHLYVSIHTIKQQYDLKEKVILKIHTNDVDGKPVSALLSIKATDRRFLNERPHSDIWAHTQLFSQLKAVNYNLLIKEDYHSYNWNSAELDKITSDTPLLENRYKARLIRKNGKLNKKPLSIIAFNPYNKKEERKILTMTDSNGYFNITPEIQSLGTNYMIKYFTKDKQKILPITQIDTSALINKPFVNILLDQCSKVSNKDTIINITLNDSSNYIERGVMVIAKENARDRYLAVLDSINYMETPDNIQCAHAHRNGNNETDYMLAAEIHTKPIRDSSRFSNGSHTYSTEERFGKKITIIAPIEDTAKIYDTILFENFNLIEMRGYNTNKALYSPDYDKEDSTIDDYRNSPYWNPEIITDANGDVILEFYTSDVRGQFEIMVEGVSMNGLLGDCNTSFQVRKKE